LDSSKLIDAMNLREDDSKRINAILDSLIKQKTAALRINDHQIVWDAHYNIFEVKQDLNEEYDVFKDGRKAIDHCIEHSNDLTSNEVSDLIPEGESIFKKDEI